MYYKAGEERNKPYGEIHGKLISNPYQQYEQAADASEQGIVEQYWYMQDGQVVYNFKTPAANAPSHWTTIRSGEKGSITRSVSLDRIGLPYHSSKYLFNSSTSL